MTEKQKIAVVISNGHNHEMGPLGLTIACGGLTSGLDVSIFLVSNGVDMARRGALETVNVAPMESHKALLADFMSRGGKVVCCTMCAKLRNYSAKDLLDGVEIKGASFVHNQVAEGAAIWNF